MKEYVDIQATEERIYSRWGMHPRYFASQNNNEGAEARRDSAILELLASDALVKVTEAELADRGYRIPPELWPVIDTIVEEYGRCRDEWRKHNDNNSRKYEPNPLDDPPNYIRLCP